MFDLDRAIAEWRTAFERDVAFARHEIDELEAHLRDSVAERIAAGERLSEAFDAVRASLGTPTVLRTDFVQVGEWSKGWLHLLRTVSSVGFVLYVGFMIFTTVAILAGFSASLDLWGYVMGWLLTPLNVAVYIGFTALLLSRGRTVVQRSGILLSVTSFGIAAYLNAGAGLGVLGVMIGLTILSPANGLTLLGLVALIIWNRERTWLRRALTAFGGLLVFFQAYLLWVAWPDASLMGSNRTFVALLLPTLAYMFLASAAWSRWVRRPPAPKLA